MVENLNTLYYALGLDDHEMQEGLKKAIQNLSVLDDEFNKINDAISKTFGKKIKNAPIHNEIKGLRVELQGMEKDWNNLTLAERRGAKGQELRAKYEALRKEAGNLNNSLARLYSESQKAASGQKGLAAQFGLVNKELTLQSRLMSNINTLFTTYISIFAVKSFIQSLAQVRGEFENQQIALRAILRDAEAADKLFGQIKSFAVVSPFEFKDLVGYAKQLSAFQVPVNELFDTTKRLADVSAGLGVGMDRIILAYGQVRSAAVLRGQELRQFTEAGIPLVDELAKKFSELEGRVVSAGDVFEKISNRMVSFGMVKEIFEDMTNEGGMFYMMQEKQAESLKGKIANLADAYDIMLNDIGQANDGILKGGVEAIAALFSNWDKVWSILKTIIIGYSSYKAAIIALTVVEKAHLALNAAGNLALTAKNLGIVISNLGRFQAALRMTGMTAKAFHVAIGGIIGILTTIGIAIYEVIQNSNKLSNELNKISSDEFSGFKKMANSLEDLSEKLKNTVQGSQEHRDIIRQINNAYGEYLPFVLDEKTALDAVANSTEQVIEAMKKRKMMMAQQKGEEAIQNTYGDENTKAKKDLLDALSVVTNSRKDAEAIIQIVSQKIDELGTKVKIFEELQKAFTDYYEGAAPKELKIFDVYESVNDLQEITLNIKKAEEELAEQNRITWGSSFRTQKAREELEKLEVSFESMRKKIRFEGDTPDSDVKNAIDEINKNEKIAKIRWRVEFDGLGQAEADRLIYQIEHPLSKVIEEVNKELTNQIKDQKELDFIKIKDPGKSLDEIKQETISQFQSAEKILEGLLETQKQWKGNEAVSDSMKKDIELTQRQIELYKERARLLGITDKLQKGGDKGKDPNAERLKEQIDLIKKAQAQYEKYLQIMSPDEALKSIQTDKQFMALDVQFKPDKVRERLQMVMNDIGKLPQSPELEKLKKSLQSTFTDIDYTDAKKNFDQFMSDLTKEIDSYKGKYDLYNQLLNLGETEEKSIDIAFGVNFGGEVDIVKYLQDKINEAVGKKYKLDLSPDIISKDFSEVFSGIEIPEGKKKKIEEFFDLLKKQFVQFQTEASKAKQSLTDMISGLENKDFNLFGKGFELDISKIARDTANAYAEIDKREKEKTEELSKFKNDKDKELYEEQLKRLRILGDKEKESIRKQSQEKLNDLAGKVINEGLDSKGLQGIFNNLSDATFKQLNQLKKYFKEIGENGIVISTDEAETTLNRVGLSIDKLKDKSMDEIVLKLNDTSLSEVEKQAISLYMQLKNGKLSAEEFDKALKKISTEKLGKTKEERLQKISNIATQAAQSVGQLGDSLYNLGEASGDQSLMEIGDALSSFGTFAESIGGILSGKPEDIIKGVFNIATQFIEAEARHQKALAEIARSKVELQREYNLLLLQQNLLFEEGTNIFNTDQIGRAINAIAVYRDAMSDFADELQGDAKKPKMNWFERMTGDSMGTFQKKMDAYNKGISALYNAEIVTGHKKTGLFGWGKGKDTYSKVLDVYPDLISNEGKLNKERAQSILDTQKMSDETRNLLQSLLDLQNQADEAYKEMQSVLQETFGSLGNDLSDSIVDAFVNGTDAAESFRISVGKILEDLAKQIMYSLFLKNKFDKLQKDLEGIYATEGISDKQIGSEVTKLLGGFFSGIGSTIDQSTKFLEEFQKQAAASGFDIFQGQTSEGLSQGIKSITEDTAQLLVSHLNAIRGSVLLQELYMKNIDTNVAGIYQAMGGSPNITTTTTIPPEIIAAISEPFKLNNTLLASIDANMANVHSISANALAQLVMIQANTYNTAMATREAVEELRGVISPGHPKGGNGIKVWA